METDLKFRPFRSPADPGWDEAWAIYQNSFPQKEIRSLEDHLQALSDPHYTADGIWSDGRLIGILYYWTAPEYVYIEHLAISPDLRGANMAAGYWSFLPEGRTHRAGNRSAGDGNRRSPPSILRAAGVRAQRLSLCTSVVPASL